MTQLTASPIGYGMPDFASGAFSDAQRREELRQEIEATIRRFEPRFLSVRVHLLDALDRLEATLRLRIEAVLHAEPAPESVTFDTLVDRMTEEVVVRPGNVV
jgi:type VI secretion system protein ImpF